MVFHFANELKSYPTITVLKEGNTVPEINLMKSMNGHDGGGGGGHAWEWPRNRAGHPVPRTNEGHSFFC